MKKSDMLRDALGLLGVALIAVGVGMIYLPAGVISAGLMLAGGAILMARAG